MQKVIWFLGGLLLGLTALSITKASIPKNNQLTDDTALYQNLSELSVKKEAKIDLAREDERNLGRLSQVEGQYRENLPLNGSHSRLKGALKRVSQEKYHYSGR